MRGLRHINFNRSSLSEQVEQALKAEILSGRLAPKQRIDLQDYRKHWSISVTPLRDAVKVLETVGLVEVSPRRGVFVSQIDRTALKEIFELRIALEPMAIQLATPLIPIEEARNALSLYAQAQSASPKEEKDEQLPKIDLLIHNLALKHCGNQRLIKTMGGLQDLIRWSQQTIIRNLKKPYETTLPEHIRICEAVCARDAAGAAEAMRVHLENVYQRIERFLEAQPANDEGPHDGQNAYNSGP
jgi:DNA-binding GntR family transcriptional regulator